MEETLVTLLRTLGYPVYALSVPANGQYPCMVFQRISTNTIRSHSGNELERARFQVSCWAKSYDEAKTVAEAVKTALDLNQINFKLAIKQDELDDKEVESKLYRKILDFYLWT